jgi:hypothetical protein
MILIRNQSPAVSSIPPLRNAGFQTGERIAQQIIGETIEVLEI